jgi:Tol biopolymer transport system component
MKPNKRFFFPLILFILVFGCITPATLVTPPPTPGNTPALPESTLTGSNTPSPTLVPSTPNATPQPSLRTSGPYLAYQDQEGSQTVIKLLDADGTGQASFSYPSNAAPLNMNLPLSNTLSSDGQWLAYYSGSAGACFGEVGPETADLTLNLMSLADGTVRVVTALLSKDYPNIFTKAARQLGRADVTADTLQNAFVCGITQSLDWSPDGRYLAFAGQMDGLSSDLYRYDSVSGTIQRLSSGPEEVEWISWSPDGKWILDGSSYATGEGMRYNIYATSLDGASIKQLSKGTPAVVTSTDWLNDHTYFDSNGDNGPGSYDLKLVDVNTGKMSELWKGSYGPVAFVPYGNWVALYANTPDWPWPYTGTDFQTGIFLVDATTLEQTRVNSLGTWGCCTPSDLAALGHIEGHSFLVKDHSSQDIEYLSSDGKLTPAGVQADKISVSPDRLDWIALTTTIQIFSDDGSPIRTVNLPASLDPKNIGSLIWRPDSSGLFFTYQDAQDQNSPRQVYALNLAKGDPVQVDLLSPSVPDNYFWVAGSR